MDRYLSWILLIACIVYVGCKIPKRFKEEFNEEKGCQKEKIIFLLTPLLLAVSFILIWLTSDEVLPSETMFFAMILLGFGFILGAYNNQLSSKRKKEKNKPLLWVEKKTNYIILYIMGVFWELFAISLLLEFGIK